MPSPPQAAGWPSLSPTSTSPAPNYRPSPRTPGSTCTVDRHFGGAWLSRFWVFTQTALLRWLPESRTCGGRVGKQVQTENTPAILHTTWTAEPPVAWSPQTTLTGSRGGTCGDWGKGLDCPLRERSWPTSPPTPLCSVTWKTTGDMGREAPF